ncbi:MAG: hypothetical protein HC857_09495 [Synechococcales cyanobacterium RU_4_20]|nr:hypothetical protein [Synechococcales cyanobacterium RU_4_20]NJR69925.1 hypothetical protein [Synechococcales cyanobacterium CRU_2_2]
MDTQTLDLNLLKTLIKESVREVLREEWFNMFQLLIPYVETEEQTEIDENLGSSPEGLAEEDFVDMTDWVTNASQV